MQTLFAEDAMVAHKRRMAPVYRSQRIRELCKKYAVLIASTATAIAMVASLFVYKVLPFFEAMR